MRPSLLDRALDLAVVPGYSRLGFALRGLGRDDDLGRTLAGPPPSAIPPSGTGEGGSGACSGNLLQRSAELGDSKIAVPVRVLATGSGRQPSRRDLTSCSMRSAQRRANRTC